MRELGKYGANRVKAAFKIGDDFRFQSPTRLEMQTGGKKSGVVMQMFTDGASLIVIDERCKWAFPEESRWYIADTRMNIAQQMYDKAVNFEDFFFGHLDISEVIVTMGDCGAALKRAKDKAEELVAQDERYLTSARKAKLKKEILRSNLCEMLFCMHSRVEHGKDVLNFINAERIIDVMKVFGVDAMTISTTPKDASMFRLEPVYGSTSERHSAPLAVAYIAGVDIPQDKWTQCSKIGVHVVKDNVQEPKGFFEPKKAMSDKALFEKSRTDAMKQLIKENGTTSCSNYNYFFECGGRRWAGTPFSVVSTNGDENRIKGLKKMPDDLNDSNWQKMESFLMKMYFDHQATPDDIKLEEYETSIVSLDDLNKFDDDDELSQEKDRIETSGFSLNVHNLKLILKALGVKTGARIVSKKRDKYGATVMIFKLEADANNSDDIHSLAFIAQMSKPRD